MRLEERDFIHCGIHKTDLIGQAVSDKHYDYLIEESSYVYLNESKPIVYLNLNFSEFDELIPYLHELNFSKSTRKVLGNANESILFGAIASKINRDNFCNVGATVSKSPKLDLLLKNKYSTIANEYMKICLPQWQKVGKSILKNSGIHSDWHMQKSFWTSGIINKNSPHQYHLDTDNIRNAHSAMFTFKQNTSGGYLVMPEYRVAFKVANRSLIFFCGKEIIHGVSPITQHPNGHRYSIVYYTTADLKYCQSYKQEMHKSIR
jgi:hypothetical protein